MSEQQRCRIGVDVGGTFTDLVLADSATGSLTFYKEPSTPAEPSLAVERGVQGILARASVPPESIELVVHGTTLGLNTIIQRRGAKVALVVSRGNRDVLEIARCRMPSSYDLSVGKEEPLVARDLVFELQARVRADGSVEAEPSDAEIARLAGELKLHGVDAVAVMLLNSYLHPTLERQTAARMRALLPGILVTESAQIWPEIREYERALVATLNAYIHPLVDSYLDRLRGRLDAIGVAAPIYVTASNGGTLGVSTAKQRPIDTVLSGPASGVVASATLAAQAQVRKIITFDMGGTSSDMAISTGGSPEYTTRTTVGDFPLILPVVNVSAIGAGGGSIIWVDPQGMLKVGPTSAGADPGPVCYGLGGSEPTVTDCYLALGYLRADGFIGGRMALDRDAAIKALEAVADKVGMTGASRAAAAAEAALRVATAKMATELHKAFAQRGLDPREFALIAYGGAGPTQANLLAEEVRLSSIVVPLSPGTLCALGALVSDLKRDYVGTVRRQLEPAIGEHLLALASELRASAAEWLQQEGDIVGSTTIHWTADIRYAGEAHELSVVVAEAAIDAFDMEAIAEAFHRTHEAVYGFRDLESAMEINTLRAQVIGRVPAIALPKIPAAARTLEATNRRMVFCDGGWQEAAVYRREELLAGDLLPGPALVEQEDTTIWILPGWQGAVDAHGLLRLTRGQ